jgi:hypothetical protein
VLGIDPVASAMAEASRRAARRGGVTNVAFVVATAEAPPPELVGRVERLTVNLPWGSLLRGALALPGADAASRGIASLIAPAGTVSMLLAPAAKDRLTADVDVQARLANSFRDDWRALGLELVEARPAPGADLAAAPTTWSRRLRLAEGAASQRAPWSLLLQRAEGPAPRDSSAA